MRTIVAGNWKMHKDRGETLAFVKEITDPSVGLPADVDVVIAPPFISLLLAADGLAEKRVAIAAQNCHQEGNGAFTGEVSAAMLKSVGVTYCIVGHSERRQYFGETDDIVAKKIAALLAQGITPIYCCGERKSERERGRQKDVVMSQMKAALGGSTIDELKNVVIAYEPVWAIGTGLNATAQQAQEMHAHIRELLHTHGADVATAVPILYGGSCKPDNAAELFACPDVNGGLIGGASLVAQQFIELIRIAHRTKAGT